MERRQTSIVVVPTVLGVRIGRPAKRLRIVSQRSVLEGNVRLPSAATVYAMEQRAVLLVRPTVASVSVPLDKSRPPQRVVLHAKRRSGLASVQENGELLGFVLTMGIVALQTKFKPRSAEIVAPKSGLVARLAHGAHGAHVRTKERVRLA